MKRKSSFALLGVSIAILLVIISVFFSEKPSFRSPIPVNGVIDLQNWSFEKKGPVSLKGEWEFYFNQFLTSDDIAAKRGGKPVYISVPSTRKSMNLAKPFPENKFYGTMRLVVKLPPNEATYGLRSSIVLSAFRLIINNQSLGAVGKEGITPETSSPYYDILNAYFNAKNNELEIIYHTSDFSYGDCAIEAPILGTATQIANNAAIGLGRDLFLFGMLLIMGLYHLGLFVMRRKDKAPFYFGFFCLFFALRMLIVGERYLPRVLPIPSTVYHHLAYICVFMGFSMLCGYLYQTLNSLFKKWFLRIGVGSGVLFSFVGIFASNKILDILLYTDAFVGFSLLGFAILRIGYGVWRNIESSTGVFIGLVSFGISLVNDFVWQLTLSNRASMIPFGITVFILTQAYTLSARFSNAFKQTEQLSEENASILVELTNMNANLESIVDERTADLKNAMLEMDIMSKIDYLTKLPNRRLMFQNIDKLVEERQSFFIALSDIDKFKNVNDSFGHDKGDEILKRVAAVMTNTLGKDGFVGRWGGEEFLMVFHTNQSTEALRIANNICEKISECTYEGLPVQITMTIGICAYAEGMAVDTCIANADNALYVGKANGRNQCHLYGEKVIQKP